MEFAKKRPPSFVLGLHRDRGIIERSTGELRCTLEGLCDCVFNSAVEICSPRHADSICFHKACKRKVPVGGFRSGSVGFQYFAPVTFVG
ncbi:MAG: hypothetical protein OXG44_16560, partial [Gammaproteobacteria bacterium]|nr:hypothetical protein [Gammaproteobacteria bacterium]